MYKDLLKNLGESIHITFDSYNEFVSLVLEYITSHTDLKLNFVNSGMWGSFFTIEGYDEIGLKITACINEYEFSCCIRDNSEKFKHINKIYEVIELIDSNNIMCGSIILMDYVEYVDYTENNEALNILIDNLNPISENYDFLFSSGKFPIICSDNELNCIYLDLKDSVDNIHHLKLLSQWNDISREIITLNNLLNLDDFEYDFHSGNFGYDKNMNVKLFDLM